MIKKIGYTAVVFIIGLCFLVGCSVKYNAVLYDNAVEWINTEFANENLTRGIHYEPDFYTDETYPSERTFIVNNREKYDEIFISGLKELDIDFDMQMLVVYTFTTVYHRNNRIKKTEVKNQVLTISYKMEEKFGVGDASMPYQRWFVVKLDAVDISSVEFVEK